MKHYIIVEADDRIELTSIVNTNINDGWEPIGGVNVLIDINRFRQPRVYSQAMIHKGEV